MFNILYGVSAKESPKDIFADRDEEEEDVEQDNEKEDEETGKSILSIPTI